MKVLRIEARFKLADDWQGTAADALRAVADFLEDGTAGLDELPHGSSFGASPQSFWHGAQHGLRFNGEASVFECLPPTNNWHRVDLVDRMPRVHVEGTRFLK